MGARIEAVDNLYGKYDKENMIDNDFTGCFQFPVMKREVYIEDFLKEDGTKSSRVRE